MKNVDKNINIFKKYYSEYLILLLILILGFLIRLYRINSPLADWHSFRQADTASVSRIYKESGVNLLYPKYHDISRVQSGKFNPQGYRFVEFPLFNAVHALLSINFPSLSFEVCGRLVALISSIFSAFFIYLIGKKIYDSGIGLIAATVFLFLPFNIYFSRVILPEPTAVAFAIASLYFFMLYTKGNRVFYLFLFSLLFSLGILVKPYIVFYGIPCFFWLLKNLGLSQIFKKRQIWISFLIIFLPFILWRIWMLKFPEGIPFWKWTFNGDGIRFRPAFFRWIFGERLGYLILGVWGLVPLFWGLIGLKRKDWFINSLLIGMLLYVSTFATANVRHDYYQTMLIPVVALIISIGIKSLWNFEVNSSLYIRSILVFSLGTAFLVSWSEVREFYLINHPEIIKAGIAVDRLAPHDSLVIADYNGDTAFLYHTKRSGWPVVELPIDELIEEGADFYASVNLDNSQTQDFISKFKVLEKTSEYVIIKLK